MYSTLVWMATQNGEKIAKNHQQQQQVEVEVEEKEEEEQQQQFT